MFLIATKNSKLYVEKGKVEDNKVLVVNSKEKDNPTIARMSGHE